MFDSVYDQNYLGSWVWIFVYQLQISNSEVFSVSGAGGIGINGTVHINVDRLQIMKHALLNLGTVCTFSSLHIWVCVLMSLFNGLARFLGTWCEQSLWPPPKRNYELHKSHLLNFLLYGSIIWNLWSANWFFRPSLLFLSTVPFGWPYHMPPSSYTLSVSHAVCVVLGTVTKGRI
jgi:hypothetical protein